MDEIEANFTSEFENKSIQLSDDIQDVFLNPHLHSQEPVMKLQKQYKKFKIEDNKT